MLRCIVNSQGRSSNSLNSLHDHLLLLRCRQCSSNNDQLVHSNYHTPKRLNSLDILSLLPVKAFDLNHHKLDILNSLDSTKAFSSLDSTKAFNSLDIHKELRKSKAIFHHRVVLDALILLLVPIDPFLNLGHLALRTLSKRELTLT